ncbi:hypothetical protein ILUMI_05055 [Ignelater luminosus]|uniref:DDE-1 domain-containing protein n=1 Tax=Ignelater luminosus TaxID=2038154 RepID=A0A8K0DBQ4_IGNLU|nr:hypothetical protein ILUMI_05055 [Ignelater luminosus]
MNNMSIRQACGLHDVYRATVQNHLHGRVLDIKKKTGPAPLLTNEGKEKIIKEAESINKARSVVTEESIRQWFGELQSFLKDNNFEDVLKDCSGVFNCNEAGFQLCLKTRKVIAPKGFKNVYSIEMRNEKELLTVLMAFTASGKICSPLIVFPYVRPSKAVVQSMPETWVSGRSDNGHKSHTTLALSEFCDKNQIILYALPPNTTHILQPADGSVFRSLKQGWNNTIRKWQSKPENINSSVNKTNFCRLFDETLRSCEMTTAIINRFKRCELFPLNPNKVDFTKCVKNFHERHQIKNNEPENEITVRDLRSTEKVIKKLEDRLHSLQSKEKEDENLKNQTKIGNFQRGEQNMLTGNEELEIHGTGKEEREIDVQKEEKKTCNYVNEETDVPAIGKKRENT